VKRAIAVLLVIAATASVPGYASETELKACKVQSDCQANEFCNTSPGCNDGATDGACTVKPEICTMEYLPVKACNGETYASKCQAFSAGQPVTVPADSVKEEE